MLDVLDGPRLTLYNVILVTGYEPQAENPVRILIPGGVGNAIMATPLAETSRTNHILILGQPSALPTAQLIGNDSHQTISQSIDGPVAASDTVALVYASPPALTTQQSVPEQNQLQAGQYRSTDQDLEYWSPSEAWTRLCKVGDILLVWVSNLVWMHLERGSMTESQKGVVYADSPRFWAYSEQYKEIRTVVPESLC